MGLFDGAKQFINLLVGDEEEKVDFPRDWKLQAGDYVPEKGGKKKTPDKKKPRKADSKTRVFDPDKLEGKVSENQRALFIERGSLELLILLQREGRLIDFLEQDIEGFEDEDIGLAARGVHKGCRKVLKTHFSLAPILDGVDEGDDVTINKGFNREEIRLIGNVKGDPPFKGSLQHHGWKTKKVSLPKVAEDVDTSILACAEVEL